MIKTPSGNEAILRGKMTHRMNHLLAVFVFVGILGWQTGRLEAANKNKMKTVQDTIALLDKEESSPRFLDIDTFIAENYTIFKENIPLKKAEKIVQFLNKNGLTPQLAVAPDFEGEKRQDGEDPSYDILIPLSEQAVLEKLIASEFQNKKEQQEQLSVDITPSAKGCCNSNSFVISAEFLYWKVTEDDIFYGERIPDGTNTPPDGIVDRASIDLNFIEQPFEWDPGVRVGIGYNLPYYGWDVNLAWTYIQSHPELHMFEDNFGIVTTFIMTSPVNAFGFETDTLKANWHLVFNSLDLVLGRSLFLSRKLSIRPNGGLKTAWIRQKFGFAPFVPVNTIFNPIFLTIQNAIFPIESKNDFWGIGPRFGLDSRYVLPLNFGVFFQTAAALLYGKFELETTFDRVVGTGLVGTPYTAVFRQNKHRLVPWLQLELGLDWMLCFGKHRSITFRAGYECQFWWAQNRTTYDLFSADPKGNLMMNGLTLQGKFDF